MDYNFNIKEVTYALSGSLDLVGIDDNMHGKRVAFMAVEIAKKLSWSDEDIDELYAIGMLHDCGVSSTDVHSHLVSELDWDNSDVHCVRGEELLSQTTIYKKYASYIKYHHTHYVNLPDELSDDIKDKANLIYMVDRVDTLRAQAEDMSAKSIKIIQDTIEKYSGEMFNPKFVEPFLKISSKSSFWFFLEDEALKEYCREWVETGKSEDISFATLKEIALMFGAVVDAKSSFTSKHSIGVSYLARYLAQLFELSEAKCELIELTALFHDLGKLKVDDNILAKPAPLNEDERLKMNRHGFDSFVILNHIKGFKEISYLASLHHETLDGNGYPYGLKEKDIPFEARIITVADIFQALVQDRPYRAGLSAEKACLIIENMKDEGKLDVSIVQKLRKNLEDSYAYARVEYQNFKQ